ncbi:hypothetical protein BS50DRAFT_122960 [Corynespora cassiicola Philippines]|uniref:Uncharacterized protein n=1 Tax=Corynespora cassiicola Philippines TaxID=1448308 RepID=A0A2T2NAW1_CORCC|nr:hypothetical protein BS50DRAFT_122960 [Corynespora cassiicola Philippines]
MDSRSKSPVALCLVAFSPASPTLCPRCSRCPALAAAAAASPLPSCTAPLPKPPAAALPAALLPCCPAPLHRCPPSSRLLVPSDIRRRLRTLGLAPYIAAPCGLAPSRTPAVHLFCRLLPMSLGRAAPSRRRLTPHQHRPHLPRLETPPAVFTPRLTPRPGLYAGAPMRARRTHDT